MDIQEIEQRQEFISILKDLAASESLPNDKAKCDKIYHRLKTLYTAKNGKVIFRHFYSDIFGVLVEIKSDPSSSGLDVLSQNMAYFRENYEWTSTDIATGLPVNIKDSINKLYDHLNLDIARMHYTDDLFESLRGLKDVNYLENVRNLVNDSLTQSDEAMLKASNSATESITAREKSEKALKESELALLKAKIASKKAADSQKEYIAILGIFSAVALTFTSGIVFTGSVLQNIGSASIYRLLFVSLLIGLVLFNSLYIMFHYIDRLVHGEKQRTVKPLVIPNCIMVGLIVLILLSWCSGVAEKRNKKVENIVNQPIETVIPSPAPSENNEAIPSYMPSQIPVETD